MFDARESKLEKDMYEFQQSLHCDQQEWMPLAWAIARLTKYKTQKDLIKQITMQTVTTINSKTADEYSRGVFDALRIIQKQMEEDEK